MGSGITEELLEFISVLAQTKHMGLAARRLGLSEPKASRLLAHAREVFPDPLFTRHGHGLAPTHRAHAIASRAPMLLQAMRALCDDVVFSPSKLERVFHFACLDNAIAMAIDAVMPAFLRAAPHAGMSFRMHNERSVEALRGGELDFGIFPAVNLPEDLSSTPLLTTPYVNVVRAGHPLEKLAGTDAAQAELCRYRRIQIVVHPDTDPVDGGIPGPAKVPLTAGQTAVWTDSWLGALMLLRHSDAVLALPWRTALRIAENIPIAAIGPIPEAPLLEPSLIWHRRHDAEPAFVWLRSLFAANIPPGPDAPRFGRIGASPQTDHSI